MGRGRRYNGEAKLNMKKVFAVIIAILVIIMFIFIIYKLVANGQGTRMTSVYYFTALEDNKYGVINNKGETIIDPAYQEYIVIPNSGKDIFLCTYDVDYENNTYKTKALNSKNEEIFTDYSQIEAISNYDKNNNLTYEQNLLRVQKDGKYGMIDINGNEILPCEYDRLYSLKNTDNSIIVEKDRRKGLVDSTGKKVIDTEYKDIKALGTDYKLGYIVIDEDNNYGVVDCNNQKVLETKYKDIKQMTDDGKYIVKEKDNWELVNKDGTAQENKALEDARDVIGIKLGNIIIENDKNKFGVINQDGEEIVSTDYDSIAFAFTDTFIVEEKGKFGLVNAENKMVIDPIYESMSYVESADLIEASEDGITSNLINNSLETKLSGIVSEINTSKSYIKIRVNDQDKYYNFRFEEQSEKDINTSNTLFLTKQAGKYGFVDKNDKEVVECIYDDAKAQNAYGYAAVQKDGKWGVIDQTGKVVVEPTYDLSDSMQIDFIGEWHLGNVDSNATYYTK